MLMLNKFLIPAALIATVVIAGIFAFMPIEKASTVHGTLATSASQTTTDTNVDAELDALDRAMTFNINTTAFNVDTNPTYPLIPAKTGKALTGHAVLTSVGNQNGATLGLHECGLVSINSAGVAQDALTGNAGKKFMNATRGNSTAGVLDTSLLTAGEGIGVQREGTGGTQRGVCIVTIFLDSNSGE